LEATKVGKKDEKPKWSYIIEADSYEQEDENGDMVIVDPNRWANLP
jgi:hypothetical protein